MKLKQLLEKIGENTSTELTSVYNQKGTKEHADAEWVRSQRTAAKKKLAAGKKSCGCNG